MGDGTQSSGSKPTREELNAKAAALGVENPEDLDNMGDVEKAIEAAEAEPRFSRQEVLDNARSLTGYSRNHMVGALHGDDRETFTKDEATRTGKEFGEREVEVR